MDTIERIEQIKKDFGNTCFSVEVIGEDIVVIYLLAFHCAVIINPEPFGGYEQRYCYHNPIIATMAISEFKEKSQWRYWKKDHTANISVACGNRLFKPESKHIPEEAFSEVDWDISEFDVKYPYNFYNFVNTSA
tara:strand:- start:14000 stop:14401 length:402 start_codon:yes stop_codon:yes gene_type:complete